MITNDYSAVSVSVTQIIKITAAEANSCREEIKCISSFCSGAVS